MFLQERYLFLFGRNSGQCPSWSNLASGEGIGFGFDFIEGTGVNETAPFFDGRPTCLAVTFPAIGRALVIAEVKLRRLTTLLFGTFSWLQCRLYSN